MDSSTAMETLTAILGDLGIPEAVLHEETLLQSHLGLDSVETVRLALELKRRLGINLKLGTHQDMTLAEICQLAQAARPAEST